MRAQALRARPRRRGLAQGSWVRAAPSRTTCWTASSRPMQPNQKWVADFTYIWTAEGWLYVAVVLDLYSRRAVGWSMQASMTSQLVADALMMAVWRRGRPAGVAASLRPGQPVHQRALPEAAQRTRHHLQHEPRRRGLGQLGDGELLQLTEDRAHGQQGLPQSRAGQADVFDYIERFYNPTRRHSTLGLRQSDRVRESSRSLGRCPLNRQQPTSLLIEVAKADPDLPP